MLGRKPCPPKWPAVCMRLTLHWAICQHVSNTCFVKSLWWEPGEKRHSCQTREEMLFSPLCSGFSIAGAVSHGSPPHHPFLPHTHTRCLHFRNLNWGPSRGFTGKVGVGWEGKGSFFFFFQSVWNCEGILWQVPERSFLIPEFLAKLEITSGFPEGRLYPHQEGEQNSVGRLLNAWLK